jgi:hypothetical protein
VKIRGHNQYENILAPLPQRRYFGWEDAEAIEQVLTEPPRFDLLFQIPIGRGHDANIDDVGD